jgi:hypothetical protein
MNTRNFAGCVALALRPIVCTSSGPSRLDVGGEGAARAARFPDGGRDRAASYALADRISEARRVLDHLRQLDPALRLANLPEWLPMQRPENLATFAEGLRVAGLPE